MRWSREIAGRRSSSSPEEVTSQRTQELLSAQRFAVPCLHPWPGLCHRNAKSPCAGGTHSISHGLSREVPHLASPLRLPPSYTSAVPLCWTLWLSFKGQPAGLLCWQLSGHLVVTKQQRGALSAGPLLPNESSCCLGLHPLPWCLALWHPVFDNWRRYLGVLWEKLHAHDHRW